jgi:hypothetical protein
MDTRGSVAGASPLLLVLAFEADTGLRADARRAYAQEDRVRRADIGDALRSTRRDGNDIQRSHSGGSGIAHFDQPFAFQDDIAFEARRPSLPSPPRHRGVSRHTTAAHATSRASARSLRPWSCRSGSPTPRRCCRQGPRPALAGSRRRATHRPRAHTGSGTGPPNWSCHRPASLPHREIAYPVQRPRGRRPAGRRRAGRSR